MRPPCVFPKLHLCKGSGEGGILRAAGVDADPDRASSLEQVSNAHLPEMDGMQKAQNLMDSVMNEFYEYQLASYLYAYTSFMEIMLLKDFDAAPTVAEKMDGYAQKYSELYTDCRAQIAAYQKTAIESQLIGGLGNVAKTVGKTLANVPILSKGPVDEAMINAGEALGKHNQEAVAKKLEKFAPLEDSRMGTFIDNAHKLDLLYMKMTEKEKEALYEKLEHPERVVKCPRCGNEIIYERRGNSIAVECKTPKFIYGGMRGL